MKPTAIEKEKTTIIIELRKHLSLLDIIWLLQIILRNKGETIIRRI